MSKLRQDWRGKGSSASGTCQAGVCAGPRSGGSGAAGNRAAGGSQPQCGDELGAGSRRKQDAGVDSNWQFNAEPFENDGNGHDYPPF